VKIKISQIKNKKFNWREISPRNFVRLISLIAGIIFLISILILVFFPDPFINTFLKNRITKTFAETYPEYRLQIADMHYNFRDNRLGCDSLKLESTDSSLKFSTASVSVSGISWLNIFLKSDENSSAFNGAVIDAKNILFNFQKTQYQLHANQIHLSVPDSEMIADSIKYYVSTNDQQFFSKSKFRQTRFRFDIPKIKIIGMDCLALLKENIYNARSINIHNIFADILVNKDKPYDTTSSNPLMPHEAFLSIKETIKLDSLNIKNGYLKYRERFSINTSPALITFNKIKILVTKISNHKTLPDTTIVYGEGDFMNTNKMKLYMKIPLTSKDFSLIYSGSFGPMDVTKLNSFIEPSEHQRIKSGSLQSANYNITVNSGNANGSLNLAYKDLNVAILNEKTNSENGIFDKISSFIGKILVIRGTNSPDEKGISKIGKIKYNRNPQDYFIQYIWFALRSGVGDVVGF
jgi:hypothetical protein